MLLFRKTGVLVVNNGPCQGVDDVEKSLTKLGSAHERLDGLGLKRRFPMLSYSNQATAILDPDGGILKADKGLKAFQVCCILHTCGYVW